jgi:tRNA modification GTPase
VSDGDASLIPVSAITGEGIEDARRAIVGAVGLGDDDISGVTITRKRHCVAIESAADAVGHAVEAIGSAIPPDVIGVDIMTALDHLGEIAGATSAEDVLDRIFSEFCIGK